MSEQTGTVSDEGRKEDRGERDAPGRERDDGGDRRRSGGSSGSGGQRRYRKKVLDTRNLVLDYKHPDTLERFLSKTGKILPRRMTGATARIQRKIAREIRLARMVNLLPFNRR